MHIQANWSQKIKQVCEGYAKKKLFLMLCVILYDNWYVLSKNKVTLNWSTRALWTHAVDTAQSNPFRCELSKKVYGQQYYS